MRPILIVGAGFAGSVTARYLADAGKVVHVIDKRNHLAGNAYDELDNHGVLIHRYGPHIFHTNSSSIFEWLSRFSAWRKYEHRVLSMIEGRLYPFPINRTTLNGLYGINLSETEAAEFYEKVREPRDIIATSEDLVLNSVGRDLYEKFFLNYTRKQWGLEPAQLKAGVAARIPVRTNEDDRYFTDKFQGMPLEGYSKMFRRMLDHRNIEISLGLDLNEVKDRASYSHMVYTGRIDEYFSFRYGRLPYRSLHFEHEHLPGKPIYQEVGTVNYPNDQQFTRITEFKHLTGQNHSGTSIVREYPCAEGDPYYPIPTTQNEATYQKYKILAELEANHVTFVGRLAQYRYYNMDQVAAAALSAAAKLAQQL
ncbi:UDP-galactopyranose mutase [Xylophilus ampelinus]|nr:UDP-galactopyranose mutase [Xylophilus ampelinus]|tara:strand:- start:614 stop:1711 length:1098 start_codon:yes stop_codon:yes gene_type:complete